MSDPNNIKTVIITNNMALCKSNVVDYNATDTINNVNNANNTCVYTSEVSEKHKISSLKKKKKSRCSYSSCGKKLSIIDMGIGCKCNLLYCGKHRLPEAHNCSFDHKKEARDATAKTLNEHACITKKIIQM